MATKSLCAGRACVKGRGAGDLIEPVTFANRALGVLPQESPFDQERMQVLVNFLHLTGGKDPTDDRLSANFTRQVDATLGFHQACSQFLG